MDIGTKSNALAELKACRDEIEKIDREIIELIAKRLAVAMRTTGPKERAGLPVLDREREAEVMGKAVAYAQPRGIPENVVRDLFRRIIDLSGRIQIERE